MSDGQGKVGRCTVSLEFSPIFFPTSSFVHLFVLSSSPLLEVRPGTMRGIFDEFEEVIVFGLFDCSVAGGGV